MATEDEPLDPRLEAEADEELTNPGVSSAAYRAGIGFMLFALGIACGLPVAIFMPNLVTGYGQTILAIIMGALLFATILLSIIFIFREPIWRWMFRRGEVEITQFAGPLADVARHAAEKRVGDATTAARSFAEIMLARYAWVTTRRWLVASITGLVAAIAALAGSALLFEQNKLLREQSALFREQNVKLEDQTNLIKQQNQFLDVQIQLAEADRSALVGPEVIEIGALIGAERQAYLDAGNSIEDFSLAALSTSTRSRIVAATIVARPYRYLSPSGNARDKNGLILSAIARRPEIVADPSILDDVPERGETGLINWPLSPERGDMLNMLISNSIQDTELLNFAGADFSYAEFRRALAPGISMRQARLAFSDFSWTRIVESSFRGAQLEHARFENAVVRQSDFSSIASADVEPPFSGEGVDYIHTAMPGASFFRSVVFETNFARINAMVVNFDDAVVAMSDFTEAQIGGASFRNALIIDSDFTGTSLLSVDLTDAIVLEQTFVGRLADDAMSGSFVADRWRLEPIPAGEVANHPGYIEMTNHLPESAYVGKQAWRIKKAEEQPAPEDDPASGEAAN